MKSDEQVIAEYKALLEFNENMDKIYKRNLILFHTEYEYNGEKLSSNIFAKSKEEAEEILKVKRKTEKIIGYNPNELHINLSEFI